MVGRTISMVGIKVKPHHIISTTHQEGGGASALLEKLCCSGCHLLVLSLVATKAKLYIFDHFPLFDETFRPIKLCNTPISPKTVQTVHVVDGDWVFFLFQTGDYKRDVSKTKKKTSQKHGVLAKNFVLYQGLRIQALKEGTP